MNTELVIRTRGLTCYFGDRPAVHGLDLDVPRGCVFAFLGRNGSRGEIVHSVGNGGGFMRTLIQRELREHGLLALIALGVGAVPLIPAYQSTTARAVSVARGTQWGTDALQPLMSSTLLTSTLLFCGLYGAILGWLQIMIGGDGNVYLRVTQGTRDVETLHLDRSPVLDP